MIFFAALLVLSLIFAFEFVLFKLYHLRRAYQISRRQVQDLTLRIEALENHLASRPKPHRLSINPTAGLNHPLPFGPIVSTNG
jgi:hypothetical protein